MLGSSLTTNGQIRWAPKLPRGGV